jgi:hypothetical protein
LRQCLPAEVDARQMMRQSWSGNFRAAYRQYARQAIFPGIVSGLLPQPCRNACIRGKKKKAGRCRSGSWTAVCRNGPRSRD